MNLFHQYWFYLAIISVGCLALERIAPWRKQKLLRPLFARDLFWIVFNGYLFFLFFGDWISLWDNLLTWALVKTANFNIHTIQFAKDWHLALQIPVYLMIADFIEWSVHNTLHRNAVLWKIHRIHHSINIMDWAGNFRFHWLEIILYKTAKYYPLSLLGASWQAILIVAVIATTIGHLNHSNLKLSYGPLRYILNSPMMHVWHHDKHPSRYAGVNFGIVFSIWDWLFGTAYMPLNLAPKSLGFEKENELPQTLFLQFFAPFSTHKQKREL